MVYEHAIALAVLAPMAASIPILALGYRTRASGLASALILAADLVYLNALWISRGSSSVLVDKPLIHAPMLGSLSFVLDGFDYPLALATLIVTLVISIYSVRYVEARIESLKPTPPPASVYFTIYTVMSASILGLILSTNLILFYIFLEASLLTSYALILYYGYDGRRSASTIYFIWTHVGAVLFLAASLTYGFKTGSFDYISSATGAPLLGAGESMPHSIILFVFTSFIIGLFVKLGFPGLHFWMPRVYSESPVTINAVSSSSLVGVAGFAIARIVYTLFPHTFTLHYKALVILGFTAIVYGALTALREDDLNRMLAYSTISQMGYMVLGIATGTPEGFAGAVIMYFSHAIAKSILFLSLGVLVMSSGEFRFISRCGGLARLYPVTSSTSFYAFLNLSGIPPALGFWGELLVIEGLMRVYSTAGLTAYTLAGAGVVVSFTLTVAYSFIVFKRVFLGPVKHFGFGESLFRRLVYTMLAISIIGFILFVYPHPILNPLVAYTKALVGGA